MSIHKIFGILAGVEKQTGIPTKYLKNSNFAEFNIILKGLITKEKLKEREEKGLFLMLKEDGYKIIKGNVACQGYARGIAKIVLVNLTRVIYLNKISHV